MFSTRIKARDLHIEYISDHEGVNLAEAMNRYFERVPGELFIYDIQYFEPSWSATMDKFSICYN